MSKVIIEQISGMNDAERLQFLQDNADQVSMGETYLRPLTPEELNEVKSKHAEKSIERDILDENFKELKANYKAESTPIREEIGSLLKMIRRKGEEMKGNLYYFADYDSGMMHVVDMYGNVIAERKLRANEKQKGLRFSMNKAANG